MIVGQALPSELELLQRLQRASVVVAENPRSEPIVQRAGRQPANEARAVL
jgi:hypothetical protein